MLTGRLPRACSSPPALVVDEAAADEDVDAGDDHADREEEPGHRRGEAHVEVLERLLEEVDRVEERRLVLRAAGAEERGVGLRELVETGQRQDDEAEEE